jgi:hypothetical protein
MKYYSANLPKPRKGPLSIKPFLGHLRKFCNRKTRSHQIKFDLCRVFLALTNFCSVTGVTIFKPSVSNCVRLTLVFNTFYFNT